MPEAEVSLLLAIYLLDHPNSSGVAEVAIDGAQVRVGENEFFPSLTSSHSGWTRVEQRGRNEWQGYYQRDGKHLEVHVRPGVGDVAVTVGPTKVRAECKRGPLIRRPGGRERPILQSTLGQLLTVEHVADNDVMVAAVPHTMQFTRLTDAWRHRLLVADSKIEIVLVHRNCDVDGLALLS